MAEATTAMEAALRALRHRDLSESELRERLRAKGFAEPEREEALETLARTGLLDDARFAEARARSLSARGAGDAAIRHALRGAGVASERIEEALLTIEPESERALEIAVRRGLGPKTARFLSGKGFSEEAVAGAIAARRENELG